MRDAEGPAGPGYRCATGAPTIGAMRGRLLGVGLTATVVLVGLTACVPPPSGYTGVSVDPDGNPVVVMAWCGRPPKQVVVNEVQTTDAQQPNLDAVVVLAPSLSGPSARVNLRQPAEGWSITQSSLTLDDPQATYLAYGESDSPDDLSPVYFTTDQLANLTPSTVLGQDDNGRDVVMKLSRFIDRVAESC